MRISPVIDNVDFKSSGICRGLHFGNDRCCSCSCIWLLKLEDFSSYKNVYNRIFELLSTPVPKNPPEPYLIYSARDRAFYEPESAFKVWLFTMHLRKLFVYIYVHICDLQKIMKSNILFHERDSFPLKMMNYSSFRLIVRPENQLEVLWDPLPSWAEVFESSYQNTMDVYYSRSGTCMSVEDSYRRYLSLNTTSRFIDCVHEEASRH